MKNKLLVLILTILFTISGCASMTDTSNLPPTITPNVNEVEATPATSDLPPTIIPNANELETPAINEEPHESGSVPSNDLQQEQQPINTKDKLLMAVMDVGQGDSILLKIGEHAMLIDAGNPKNEDIILTHMDKYDVTNLDYIIATHPHADHIGSLAGIIKKTNFTGTLLMPDIITTTTTFEKLLDTIEAQNLSITTPKTGEVYELGGAAFQILAPVGNDYSDINNYSIVIRVDYGNTSYLVTGDAGNISENEQLSSGLLLSAGVLKIGHHGSKTGTTEKYLQAVDPEYAVISCGKNNSYGHPAEEIMTRLNNQGIKVYRTDEMGTVVFWTDGEEIIVETD